MRSEFRACEIEIDEGIYGSWVEAKQHLGFSAKYNQEWREFFKSGIPKKEAVLAKGREMALKYKFTIHY